jgi:hypothetical protein
MQSNQGYLSDDQSIEGVSQLKWPRLEKNKLRMLI